MSSPASVPFTCGPLVGERWPDDGPTVVLLHAGVADRRAWHAVAPRLAGRFDVLTYDRRGFGESPPPDAGAPSHLADLVALLDEHVDGPVWVVGNSMGGALALDLAVTAPERVRGIVAIGAAVGGFPWREFTMDEATEAMEGRLMAAMEAGELDELVRVHTWLWLDGPGEPEGRVRGAARELAIEMCRTTMAHRLPEDAGDSGVDAWSALPELRVPTTFMVGELDTSLQRDLSSRAAARVPGARDVVLPDTAHLPMIDAPEELLAALEQALG